MVFVLKVTGILNLKSDLPFSSCIRHHAQFFLPQIPFLISSTQMYIWSAGSSVIACFFTSCTLYFVPKLNKVYSIFQQVMVQ